MSRKAVPLASMLVLLALLAFGTLATQAQDGPVEILLSTNGEYEVPAGQTVILHGRWGACRPGLVRAYIQGSETVVTLDGALLLSPEQIDQLWGPIVVDEPNEACLMGDAIYIAHWYYELPYLPPSPDPYVIHTQFFLDHPLIDGGDWDGDGKPDRFAGLFHETENTLLVYEP